MASNVTVKAAADGLDLNVLHKAHMSVEKFRVGLSNRIDSVERGADDLTPEAVALYKELLGFTNGMEALIDENIAKALNNIPVWNHWLKYIKGVGPSLAGQILALLLPPLSDRGVTTWYRAAGLMPERHCKECGRIIKFEHERLRSETRSGGWDYLNAANREEDVEKAIGLLNEALSVFRQDGISRGEGWADRRMSEVMEAIGQTDKARDFTERALELLAPTAPEGHAETCSYKDSLVSDNPGIFIMRLPRPRAGGGKITYHPGLRRALFLLATSFVRVGGFYRGHYDSYKERLRAQHMNSEEWPAHRLDASARWHTIKLFLSHLWEKWLEAEGKPMYKRPYVLDVLGHQTYIAPPVSTDKKKV